MKENKILWSLDLAVTINDCKEDSIDQDSIIKFGKELGEKIDPGAEIVGIVNPFGDHNEDMKGWRLIHENRNSLITAHFIDKTKKGYINIHSCNPYKPSEALDVIKDFFESDEFICQKIFRE